MKILCFGSLNIDHVYQVQHIAREGETIDTLGYAQHLGGKGLNQSVALSRAGEHVFHAGLIGPEGGPLCAWLEENGVDTRFVQQIDTPTGHAMIQVDREGRNCIVLHGGANQCLTPAWIQTVLGEFGEGDLLVLQNEVNGLSDLIEGGRARGMHIALNPSPISKELLFAPLSLVDIFLLNEIEGEDMTGERVPEIMLDVLLSKYPESRFVLTLGEQGAMFASREERCAVEAFTVQAVDTTAAGDTFTGYFLSGWMRGLSPEAALLRAAHASAISVSRPGASQSIPMKEEVEAFAE